MSTTQYRRLEEATYFRKIMNRTGSALLHPIFLCWIGLLGQPGLPGSKSAPDFVILRAAKALAFLALSRHGFRRCAKSGHGAGYFLDMVRAPEHRL